MEIWKDIQGCEGKYQVSNEGRIRSLDMTVEFYSHKAKKNVTYQRAGRMLKPSKDRDGYLVLSLGLSNRNKKVHRLVALAFIPNPNGYGEVGHKDCDPTNNNVDNLYWCDRKENMGNPITRDRIRQTKTTKRVAQLSLDGSILKVYDSLHSMQRETNYSRWAVGEVCKGRMNTYKGCKWKFIE